MEVVKKENGLLLLILKNQKVDHFESNFYKISCLFSLQNFHEWTKVEDIVSESYGKVIYEIFINDDENTINSINQEIKSNIYQILYKNIFEVYEKEKDFIQYHYTGHIKSSAYENINFNYSIEKYPKIIFTFTDKLGELIELRQSLEKNKYVKKDQNNEIMRDENGLALFLTDDEVISKKYLLYDSTIIAFNSQGQSVGVASDEWGADGIFISKEYQSRGIGLQLLIHFRNQFPEDRQMGQMTIEGLGLAKSYYRSLKYKK